ncbi:unnamed protein product [Onchocerca flexuosa]|uniref:Uncharacterized protein n=1 Tax=Onchocerca flexuosa TaxID=387005 RepID=A0A183HBV2_9BILA|nr:unnamed protein product [Onchocerca flexuosa]
MTEKAYRKSGSYVDSKSYTFDMSQHAIITNVSSSINPKEYNIPEEDFLESMFDPELNSQNANLVEESQEKPIIRKFRKHVNTTSIKESQYVKKIFIYRGSFLIFCSVLLGIYLILILTIQILLYCSLNHTTTLGWIISENYPKLHQIWILLSRINIKNGVWSLSPAERTTWWFDQVINF